MNESAETLPSRLLPPIRTVNSPAAVEPRLSELADLVARHIDGQAPLDDFEIGFARQWLVSFVALKCEQSPTWSETVESAARTVAQLSGPSGPSDLFTSSAPPRARVRCSPDPADSPSLPTARPAHTRLFCIDVADSHGERARVDIRLRQETLLGDSTGSQIWPAGRYLARRVAAAPLDFGLTAASAEGSRLRILELGSGTGIVGIALAASLAFRNVAANVTLSDNDEVTLRNLRANTRANRDLWEGTPTDVAVEHREWRTTGRLEAHNRFDLLFGSDLVYDVHHSRLLHSTIERHLRRGGVAHLAIALRTTHVNELAQLAIVFDETSPLLLERSPVESIPNESVAFQWLRIRWR